MAMANNEMIIKFIFLHTEYTEYVEAALGDLHVNAVLILKHEPSL